MSIFTVSATEVVQLGTGAIQPTDTFRNGVLLSSTGDLNRAISTGGDEYANGLLMTDAGQIRYFDATAGLPVDVVWSNGLPRANDGALCVSTGALATYSNGTPMVANGAVRVSIVP
jgi:hypothetical protein